MSSLLSGESQPGLADLRVPDSRDLDAGAPTQTAPSHTGACLRLLHPSIAHVALASECWKEHSSFQVIMGPLDTLMHLTYDQDPPAPGHILHRAGLQQLGEARHGLE